MPHPNDVLASQTAARIRQASTDPNFYTPITINLDEVEPVDADHIMISHSVAARWDQND